MVDGIAQKPIEGVSMAYTFDKANANAPSTRKTQYFEMFGNRAIYHDGWIAATVPPQPPWLLGTAKMPDIMTGYKWELYNIADDFSENNDLAAKNPDKLKELQALFMDEARKYQVLPLDNSFLERVAVPRPSAIAGRTEFTYSREISGVPEGNTPDFIGKSYSITADVEIPPKGAEGMLGTLGGRFGGWGLYLLKGKPVFTYNLLALERFRWEGSQALTPGKHTIVFDFKYDGPGMAKGGTGVLSVDGKEVAKKTIPHTVPGRFTIDETFDVGVDTRTGVDDNDYQPPFRFNGKLDKLTIKLEPMKAAEEKLLQQRLKTQETRRSKSLRLMRDHIVTRPKAALRCSPVRVKDQFAYPRVDCEWRDAVNNRECQQHVVPRRHASPHVADNVLTDLQFANEQHRDRAGAAIGKLDLHGLFPRSMTIADNSGGNSFRDRASGRAGINQHPQRLATKQHVNHHYRATIGEIDRHAVFNAGSCSVALKCAGHDLRRHFCHLWCRCLRIWLGRLRWSRLAAHDNRSGQRQHG